MKNFKNIKSVFMCSLMVVLILSLSGCGKKSSSTSQTNESNKVTSFQKSVEGSESASNNSDKEKDDNVSKKAKALSEIQFTKTKLADDASVEFNTPWKDSEDGSYSACIEGKGSEALEEGQGKIIVKGNDSVYSFSIKDNAKKTPKSIEWADNENLLVVISYATGTVAKGGNLYMLNVNTGDTYLVLDTQSDKKQIMSASKNGSKLELKVNIYDDDVYNESHIENWSIDPFDPTLNSDMKVKNSEGKVIFEI
jgi:hypothetical protein